MTETGTIKVSGGDLYVRGLSVTGGSPGIWATAGNILRLDHVSVSNNNAGGILLDGAGFDIKDTTVSNNGANSFGPVFGGLLIQDVPASSAIPKTLVLSTITGNQLVGVSCSAGTASIVTPSPTTILVSAPSGALDVANACGFTSCAAASTTCGAQP